MQATLIPPAQAAFLGTPAVEDAIKVAGMEGRMEAIDLTELIVQYLPEEENLVSMVQPEVI
jgi:hypothetical protein